MPPSPPDPRGRTWDSEIHCPWCGFRYTDSWDVNTDDPIKCRECEKPIDVEAVQIVEYGCRKPKEKKP